MIEYMDHLNVTIGQHSRLSYGLCGPCCTNRY